jgi:TPR repeat protein
MDKSGTKHNSLIALASLVLGIMGAANAVGGEPVSSPVSSQSASAQASKPGGPTNESKAAFYNGIRAAEKNDYATAYAEYKKAAAMGHSGAQYGLAQLYEQGNGVRKDAAQAVHWYRKSADYDFPLAQTKLGFFYYNGVGGLKKDASQAAYWYRKAADQGDAYAQRSLGVMYVKGNGIAKDAVLGFDLLRKAADQGDVESQILLASSSMVGGEGIAKDPQNGMEWYRKAAAQGDERAKARIKEYEQGGSGALPLGEWRKKLKEGDWVFDKQEDMQGMIVEVKGNLVKVQFEWSTIKWGKQSKEVFRPRDELQPPGK